jgi:hypothetical protein
VINGPFRPTESWIAGFWLWEVQSMEEAAEWVKRCPNPTDEESEIEIRPVAQLEDFAENVTPESPPAQRAAARRDPRRGVGARHGSTRPRRIA